MKNTSKILALVLVVMTLIMSLSAITASAASETVTMVFEASALEAAAAGSFTDGQQIPAGTDDFFTLVLSAKTKIDSSSKTFSDGYKTGQRLNLGGKSDSSKNHIVFTVPSAATVKVWWVSGGADRYLTIWDADGNEIAQSTMPTASNELYLDTMSISAAGTYRLASPVNSNYIFKVEVSWEATVCDHNFVDGACTLCGEADPSACAHENKSPATCTDPEKCLDCEKELSAALGHTEGAAPTCDTAQTCTVCGKELAAALGHVLTFVNTLPTAEAAGKTIADCSVCQKHFDFGEVKVMTPGTYVLDAAALDGIAQYSLFDGEVKVVNGVFACHLSYKYRTDANAKTFAADDWTSTHRMNFGGASTFCNNGEGEAAVRNGGLKNYVQIVTTAETTLTFHWGVGGDGREIAIYDMEGNLVAVTEEKAAKNDLCVSTLTVPAGAYIIGGSTTDGGNYFYKITAEVEAPHEHAFSDATCTEPAKCECGETQGEALGHAFDKGVCTRCQAADPDYVAPPVGGEDDGEQGGDDNQGTEPAPELNFFQKVIAWFVDLINKIIAIFKK